MYTKIIKYEIKEHANSILGTKDLRTVHDLGFEFSIKSTNLLTRLSTLDSNQFEKIEFQNNQKKRIKVNEMKNTMKKEIKKMEVIIKK